MPEPPGLAASWMDLQNNGGIAGDGSAVPPRCPSPQRPGRVGVRGAGAVPAGARGGQSPSVSLGGWVGVGRPGTAAPRWAAPVDEV